MSTAYHKRNTSYVLQHSPTRLTLTTKEAYYLFQKNSHYKVMGTVSTYTDSRILPDTSKLT